MNQLSKMLSFFCYYLIHYNLSTVKRFDNTTVNFNNILLILDRIHDSLSILLTTAIIKLT